MARMNRSQMEILEKYFRAREATGGITDEEIRKYVRREFGIILTRTYIPVLKTGLNKGKSKSPSVEIFENKAQARIKLININELIPRQGKWEPPFCLHVKGQEMTTDLFLNPDVHFVEMVIPDLSKE